MHTNRITRFQWQESPDPSVAIVAPEAFVVCPGSMVPAMAMAGWTWQQEVFRIAYEVARAKHAAMTRAAASDYHRLFSNWN
jgi:hypothetical protein